MAATVKRAFVTRAAEASLSFAIRCYRAVVGPWLPQRCRFSPSCSEYALDAIATHGPWTGAVLAVARLARCHPWHPGGHDPVPPVAHADRAGASSDRAAASSSPSCASSIVPHRH